MTHGVTGCSRRASDDLAPRRRPPRPRRHHPRPHAPAPRPDRYDGRLARRDRRRRRSWRPSYPRLGRGQRDRDRDIATETSPPRRRPTAESPDRAPPATCHRAPPTDETAVSRSGSADRDHGDVDAVFGRRARDGPAPARRYETDRAGYSSSSFRRTTGWQPSTGGSTGRRRDVASRLRGGRTTLFGGSRLLARRTVLQTVRGRTLADGVTCKRSLSLATATASSSRRDRLQRSRRARSRRRWRPRAAAARWPSMRTQIATSEVWSTQSSVDRDRARAS